MSQKLHHSGIEIGARYIDGSGPRTAEIDIDDPKNPGNTKYVPLETAVASIGEVLADSSPSVTALDTLKRHIGSMRQVVRRQPPGYSPTIWLESQPGEELRDVHAAVFSDPTKVDLLGHEVSIRDFAGAVYFVLTGLAIRNPNGDPRVGLIEDIREGRI